MFRRTNIFNQHAILMRQFRTWVEVITDWYTSSVVVFFLINTPQSKY